MRFERTFLLTFSYLQVELLDKKKIEMEITEQNFPCYQLIVILYLTSASSTK